MAPCMLRDNSLAEDSDGEVLRDALAREQVVVAYGGGRFPLPYEEVIMCRDYLAGALLILCWLTVYIVLAQV